MSKRGFYFIKDLELTLTFEREMFFYSIRSLLMQKH